MSNLRPQDIIEQFEIPEEYHHAIWEAYSAGADYGFFRALGQDLHPTPPSELQSLSKASPVESKGQEDTGD